MKINGEILKKIRETRLVSIAELADLSGISLQTLYLVERGRQIKIDNIRKIIHALEISHDEAKSRGLIYDD